MKLDLSDELVDRVISLLPSMPAGIRREEMIERLLEALAEPEHGLSRGEFAQLLKPRQESQRPQSALAAATKPGLAGSFDGPEDLSTNRQYMDGFGR